MKVKIFTHNADIDGMGSAVLAKLAFGDPSTNYDNVQVSLCDYKNLDQSIKTSLENGEFEQYDKIFVTDLSPSIELLDEIDKSTYVDKFQLIDHHQTAINKGADKYVFSTIQVNHSPNLRACATSLFYQHLLEHKYLSHTPALNEFVSLTRLHDTWEWKQTKNGTKADNLAQLFAAIRGYSYISSMTKKLASEKEEFNFSDKEKLKISKRREEIGKACLIAFKNISTKTIDGMKCAVSEISHKYRNEYNQFLQDKLTHSNFDINVMIDRENNSISFRRLNQSISLLPISEKFGGGGHVDAAACNFTKETANAFGIPFTIDPSEPPQD